ncbi:PO21 protein, partial [Dromaius novaehollandiae]|nr:PO21 protein [Dromaius novaehollandiae]
KAFDSLQHHHIFQVLRQKGVDCHVIDIITEMCKNSAARLEVDGTHLEKVKILTNLKQGDSMSPFLFNLSIDPLLCWLEEGKEGFRYKNSSVFSLAFVDDLVLLSDSWEGMQRSIQVVEEFCHLTGLKVQAAK